MGHVAYFNIGTLVSKYGLRHFVETGTGNGASLRYAMQCTFERLYSIEIHPVLAGIARANFACDSHVQIFEGPSDQGLESLLPAIRADEPILFWLDAHFPGADYRLAGYQDATEHEIRLPLEAELCLIHRLRPAKKDVILIDDLRIWIDAEFGNGPCPLEALPPTGKRDISFMRDLFEDTHEIQHHFAHEGYISMLPKL